MLSDANRSTRVGRAITRKPARNRRKSSRVAGVFGGVPNGIRTRVLALKAEKPRHLSHCYYGGCRSQALSRGIMADEPEPLNSYQRAVLAHVRRVEQAVQQHSAERRVASVWEYTQSVIAVLVVLTTCGGVVALSQRMPPEWWTIAGLVI